MIASQSVPPAQRYQTTSLKREFQFTPISHLMPGLNPYPRTAATCPHQVCGSIDSGYEQSLTASLLTDSSKDSCVTEGFVALPVVSVPARGAS